MTAYWHAKALGLDITAYAGPETGVKDRISYVLNLPAWLENRHNIGRYSPYVYDITSFITRMATA